MRRRSKWCILCTALTFLLSFPSTSTASVIVFEDTFDAETRGLVFTVGSSALSQWNITAGNLDIIGPGLFDFFPGNGNYLDMGGVNSNATIETKSLLTLTPGIYELSFELAFPPGFLQNQLDFSVGTLLSDSVVPTSSSTLTPVSFAFVVASTTDARITFSEVGAIIDDSGTILNDVRLTQLQAIPEPSSILTFAGLALCFGLGGWWRKRRRQAV